MILIILKLNLKTKENILICPLNWGLGHATRDIPIIKYILAQNKNVIIGGNGQTIELLKKYFPDLQYIKIYSPSVFYGKKKSFSLIFYVFFMRYIFSAVIEHFFIKKIIKNYDISVIISDNRMGLWNKKISSIFISHQLNIFLNHKQQKKSFLASKINSFLIKKYDYVIVPDFENENLSLAGRLSKNTENFRTKYIGAISRFQQKLHFDKENKLYDYLCILSGPEPQRTILENLLIQKFKDSNYNVLIIRGLPLYKAFPVNVKNISFFNDLETPNLEELIKKSENIICRSGYTSIMDLTVIERKAILIPTPNQPEQEYLAQRMKEKFGYIVVNQNDIKYLNKSTFHFS